MASDPLTWIDDYNNYEVVGMTGIEGWEQLGPDRWQFKLGEGVTFHNGAPWNATQAAFWIDFFGDEETSGHHNSNDFSFHGVIGGEVVDDYTLDVVCGSACPILPRTTIFTKFQDVGWYEQASEDEIERFTVGLGRYKIMEWTSGQQVSLEAYEGYNPNPATDYSRAPSIPNLIQQWRNEPLVRAAALAAGEADWAEIAFQDRDLAPKWKSATNNEAYVYAIDTVHHPELRKKEIREALNLAIDCETVMEEIFDGVLECYGNIAQTGTVGITPENSAGYPYDPERAEQLLAEAGYDEDNEIKLHIRSQRVPKDVEYAEAVVTFWRDVGFNANLYVVESSIHAGTGRSNCGHGRTREDFVNAPGADLHEKCANLGPGEPNFSPCTSPRRRHPPSPWTTHGKPFCGTVATAVPAGFASSISRTCWRWLLPHRPENCGGSEWKNSPTACITTSTSSPTSWWYKSTGCPKTWSGTPIMHRAFGATP